MKLLGVLAIGALLAAGCGGPAGKSNDAIRQAVIEHLTSRSGLDVSSMDVTVDSVSYNGDQADATVSFSPKGSKAPGAMMKMQYKLERKGSHWVVTGKSGAPGSPHGGAMGAPPAGGEANPHGGAAPPEMPPGHPQAQKNETPKPAGKN